jgi:hypothetical protein
MDVGMLAESGTHRRRPHTETSSSPAFYTSRLSGYPQMLRQYIVQPAPDDDLYKLCTPNGARVDKLTKFGSWARTNPPNKTKQRPRVYRIRLGR